MALAENSGKLTLCLRRLWRISGWNPAIDWHFTPEMQSSRNI